jgi:hypothetical protein
MKLKLKGSRIATIEEIQDESQEVFDTVTENYFKNGGALESASTCGRELLRG